MSSSNYLKGFGAAADVMSQLATDKALRRKQTGVTKGFNMSDGVVVEGTLPVGTSDPTKAPFAAAHNLGRRPTRFFPELGSDTSITVDSVDATNIYLRGNDNAKFSLWVV